MEYLFKDVSRLITDAGFIDTKFADDLIASKSFRRDTLNDSIMTGKQIP